jgi:YidC/Oxa1 family membrane protein insertase
LDKRTILAIILSTIVITVGYLVPPLLFPKQPATQPAQTAVSSEPADKPTTNLENKTTASAQTVSSTVELLQNPEYPDAERTYTISTDVFDIVFTNRGGEMKSVKMKKHLDKSKQPVEMILNSETGADAFALSFGDVNSAPVKQFFATNIIDKYTIEFSRSDFLAASNDGTKKVPFTLKKRFAFKPKEYLFELSITLENSVNEFINLNSNNIAYSLKFGPQIGPKFAKLSQNYEYRKYRIYANGKRSDINVAKNGITPIKDRVAWASITGKYFSLIGIPDEKAYQIYYDTIQHNGISDTSEITFSRPVIKSSTSTDTFYFFLGPKVPDALSIYNDKDRNAYGFRDLKLDLDIDRSTILGWLEEILKFFMLLFYKVIPNYGVSIILLTLLVKILFFPLTKKGSMSTARMQELQPKIQEMQKKYKDNPTKLNQEMANFYKAEGYNPLSGCLPMLIQIPLFFAMYNLFNNHFDLRGAGFIPGWIPDLSAPETVWDFSPIKIPLLGWSNLRLLPIIYLASQLVYGVFTQTPDQKSNSQMKIMLYGMPIMFFFILYDAPAGLLVYWIVSNLLTIVQQLVINDILKKHKAAKAK